MSEEENETVRIPMVLSGVNDVPIVFVNWMSVSHQGTEFILTLGQYSQPVVVGDESQRREQLGHIGAVPIKVVGRFGIPGARMIDMVRALSENLSKYEQKKGLDQ